MPCSFDLLAKKMQMQWPASSSIRFSPRMQHICPKRPCGGAKEEWTYEASATSWRRPLCGIASGVNKEECIFVACEENGDVIGLAMGMPAEGFTHTGEVSALYVQQGFQGRGIGRRLVQAVAAWLHAQGHTVLHIAVLAANAPARKFYEAIGGTVIGEREFEEYGFMLPGVVYGWPDIRTLIPSE